MLLPFQLIIRICNMKLLLSDNTRNLSLSLMILCLDTLLHKSKSDLMGLGPCLPACKRVPSSAVGAPPLLHHVHKSLDCAICFCGNHVGGGGGSP